MSKFYHQANMKIFTTIWETLILEMVILESRCGPLKKAFILDPRDPDIKFNLDYLRSLVRDRIIAPKDLFLLSMYKKTIEKFTLSDLFIHLGCFITAIINNIFFS